MSTADKLNAILQTKEAIKQAIIAKGVEVEEGTVFADYPNKIASIEAGGGSDELLNLRTNNGENMAYLFHECNATELDLSSFDISNARNMNHMFSNCYDLQTLNISNFDTSNVEDTNYMFENSNSLHTVRLDNGNRDTVERINGELPEGDVKVEGNIVQKKIYVNPENIDDLTEQKDWVFFNCLTDTEIMPELTVYEPYEYEGNGDIVKVNTLVNSEHDDLSNMFSGCYNLRKIFNMEQWDTSNVTTMANMFTDCNNLKELNVSGFDTGNVTSMERMFYYCNSLTELDVSDFDTADVTTMANMFTGCSTLRGLDLSNFVTTSVTDMSAMFADNNLITLYLSNFNTSNVTSMYDMFARCRALELLDISNFDMSNVDNADYMFVECNNLHTLRLDNCDYDTINKIINSLDFPTNGIDGTRKIYVNSENIINPKSSEILTLPENWVFVDGIREIYREGCYADNEEIVEVDTLVLSGHTDLSNMFNGCTNLETINSIDNWETGNVDTMENMFRDCTSLTELDLSSFDTANVTNMTYMFAGCTGLRRLNISNFDMINIGDGYAKSMFASCVSLVELNLNNCNNDTIDKIINSANFPTGTVEGKTRAMYVKEANITGLTAPEGWEFIIKEE